MKDRSMNLFNERNNLGSNTSLMHLLVFKLLSIRGRCDRSRHTITSETITPFHSLSNEFQKIVLTAVASNNNAAIMAPHIILE